MPYASPSPTLSPAPSPARDATVVRTGRRGALTALPVCLVLIALGLARVVGLIMVATGTAKGEVSARDVAGDAGVRRARCALRNPELCPGGPIDDRDPVLWLLVRDEEPIAPGLPRLRYRLPLPPGSQDKVTAAIRQYAPPHLWLGESQRGRGHIGRPDLSRRPGR
ncbi:hypothetical protein DY245_28580 [Streptomyces inhibens]|uniref:Uncharacterized protein n=2 Tax=Streptomyces inhibens TaxID=2293571 RepID=A0A371PXA2_STRIH|nr:hypothetical protein DY245_28580 [Streptomyces inhibens]